MNRTLSRSWTLGPPRAKRLRNGNRGLTRAPGRPPRRALCRIYLYHRPTKHVAVVASPDRQCECLKTVCDLFRFVGERTAREQPSRRESISRIRSQGGIS